MYRAPFYTRGGVVASEHPIASVIGAEVLKRGGNAFDAAVATSLALAVTLPHLGGLGGDFFALARLSSGEIVFINGSGYAPSKLTPELVRSRGFSSMPRRGPLAISVPGMVDGLHLLWKRFGSLEWRELVKPSAELAQRGFPASRSLAISIQSLLSELSGDPGWLSSYARRGRAPRTGDLMRFEGLARALEMIAEDPRSFYEGEVAEAIVSYVQERGGVLTLDDLRGYRAEEDRAIDIVYRGRRIYEMPPNTQGVTTLHMLMLLEDGLDPRRIGPRSSERIELFLRAARAAYWARDSYVTDPRFMKVGVEELLSREFIERLRSAATRTGPRPPGDGDTTFFAVVDAEGNAVAGIQSLFYAFGSGVVEPRFQVPLNSRASSFSLDPGHINRLEPGKKTMHTLSAVIVEDGDRVLVVGLSGGHYRPLLHAQLLTNLIDYSMDPQEAIEHPRFLWELWSDEISVEEGYDVGEGLRRRYRVTVRGYPSRLGVAAIAELRPGFRAGYCDIRGDGLPVGTPV